MNPLLKRMFQSLPQVFNKDPGAQNAIRVTREPHLPPPDPTLSLIGETLIIGPFTWNLRDWSLGRLAEDITAKPEIRADLLDQRLSKLLAASLNGDETAVLPVTLTVATNPLIALLEPMSWALEDHEVNIDAALAQLNILTSQEYFADFWGRSTGVIRNPGEDDAAYTQRIVDTVLLKRDNNKALEVIVQDTFGLTAQVTDLYPMVLVVSRTIGFSKIAGEVYNVCNFICTTEMTPDDVLGLLNQHRAGGTKVFLRQSANIDLIDDQDAFSAETYEVSIFDASFIPEQELAVTTGIDSEAVEINVGLPQWTVGATPMPGSEIA